MNITLHGWNLTFDYAAMLICILLLIWYFDKKRIPIDVSAFFVKFIISIFLCALSEVMAVELARMNVIGELGFNLLMSLYSFLASIISVVYASFLMVYLRVEKKHQRRIRFFLDTVLVLTFIIDILTPFTQIGFYFYGDSYEVGAFGGFYALLSLSTIVTSIGVVLKKRAEISNAKAVMLIVSVLFGSSMFVVQLAFTISLLTFGFALVALTLYNYIFNPAIYLDNLTNLYNKDCMRECLNIRFDNHNEFSILFIAMDDFKYINKTFGVDNGDNLLIQVGNYIRQVDGAELVFEYGSDQFAVICQETDEDKIYAMAETIQARFKHPWYTDSTVGAMMSASICCFKCPEDASNYGNLIEIMDYSMAMVKKTNKGGISKASELEVDKLRSEKEIEKAVKLAIDREELMVYYQPIFSIEKNKYNSAEALVRINDEQLGWISPEIFIPLAEKNGLIISMGNLIFKMVCQFIRDNNLAETDIEYIEVNISPVQLQQPDYYKKIIEIMEKYDVKPSQINIEITETANMVGASDVVNNNIEKLVEYGLTFSLDDYGSGYSNLDYINHMPFHIIKIDKFIVWDAFENIKAGITLEYTIKMLNALQYMIVAEGVETEEQKDQLANIGCHYMQGWYYSKAVSDKEFMQLINKAS
ncbi:MAG: EAL domain-containing protein [Lachnospiraceae bacterium]|nr:EAL domain-containing protein [Lachnospiraceae bacterium]